MHLTKPTCHIALLSVFPPQVSCHPIGPALLYCWHTVNQCWADVFCEVIEVFSHLMFFDILLFCRYELLILYHVYHYAIFCYFVAMSS